MDQETMSPLVDRAAYQQLVASWPSGKRLPEALYLHQTLIASLPVGLQIVVERAITLAHIGADAFNVVKFAARERRVSLLAYPDFFDTAFPMLHTAWTVDIDAGTVRHRDYASDANPPLLHRKERLLPIDHPAVPGFAALTATAERLGLFDEVATIGLLRGWTDRLRSCGVQVDGHRLVSCVPPDPTMEASQIARHRTALHRRTLSTPMQLLARHGYLDGAHSVFDYGCGRGDDVAELRDRGLVANGWDPHFASNEDKREADVVNLGFVLNVIEDIEERRSALLGAYKLAGRLLVVAALIGGRMALERRRLFRDGVLTQRGTFQKYFTQPELRAYLEQTLGREPVAVAPGVFFMFRNDDGEQQFLAARQSRPAPRSSIPRARESSVAAPRVRLPRVSAREKRWLEHGETIDTFYAQCLALGRIPQDDEFERWEDLRAVGTAPTVLRRLLASHGPELFEAARDGRRDDLLVYLSLNQFERRRSFGTLPDRVRRDARAIWGTYSAAQADAGRLLFSVANAGAILTACQSAAANGVGYLDGEHSLQLHASLAPRLPPLLRVYLGCASRLYGDVEGVDLVKLHTGSGKVSLMTYDDFAGRAVPDLLERVKINLRAQEIDFFEYGEVHAPQPLYLKSRYMAADTPGYDQQHDFDEALNTLNAVDLSGFGPSRHEFDATLKRLGYSVDGFALRKQ